MFSILFQSPDLASLRSGGVRLSITNSLDILRDRLRREMERTRNKKQVGSR